VSEIKIWAFIGEGGEILADSTWLNSDDAYRVGLGWPSREEIKEAKDNGARAVLCTLTIPEAEHE